MKTTELTAETIPTPDGTFTAHYSSTGLAALDFPSGKKMRGPGSLPAAMRGWHKLTATALKAALAGRAPNALPPLDLSGGTLFQQRVWVELRKIGPGETRSYGEVARAVGKPRGARAVGAACGANPIPVLVPCHRVLAANGKLGGFSGGLEWKRRLLARESK